MYVSVNRDGSVCISILHEPGDDRWGYEKPEERWLPVHTVETILVSVISMLADPNSDSPANVDAAVGPVFFKRSKNSSNSRTIILIQLKRYLVTIFLNIF